MRRTPSLTGTAWHLSLHPHLSPPPSVLWSDAAEHGRLRHEHHTLRTTRKFQLNTHCESPAVDCSINNARMTTFENIKLEHHILLLK